MDPVRSASTVPEDNGIISPSSNTRRQSQQTLIPTSLSARQYADAIDEYSKLETNASIYAGLHFQNLAAYIRRPLEARQSGHISLTSNAEFQFTTIRDLNPGLNAADRVRHFNSVDEFQLAASKLVSSTHGHIVFMRGHPSPEWLLAIGHIYQLDPQFFRQHLDFRPDRKNYFDLPSLPSASTCVARLTVSTLGNIQESFNHLSQPELQSKLRGLQDGTREAMRNYGSKVKEPSNSNTGDSILRECSIHDLENFSIEQDISLHVCRTQNSWVAFIWLDHGSDLSNGLTAWLTSPTGYLSTTYLPTIQHKRAIALKQRNRLLAPLYPKDRQQMKNPQTASLLHLDYGRRLDPEAASADSFYAMHEILSFVAFSEVQCLNMLQSVLKKELSQAQLAQHSNPTLSNLLYQQEILERHSQRLQHIIDTIRDRAQDGWPRALTISSESSTVVDSAAESLKRDFDHLLMRCQNLLQQCTRGTQVVAHNATIKESRKAIQQAEEVAKLTQLAFFFIPLTFVTSVFGMNCKGLEKSELWVWAVVSVPFSVVSFLLLKYDLSVVWEFCRRGVAKFGGS